MQTKLFEILDRATFIPVMATEMRVFPRGSEESQSPEQYLLRRAGYGPDNTCIMVMKLTGAPQSLNEPWQWGGRTMPTAHQYIQEHWYELTSGDVIDVEFVLGEVKTPKRSERET